MEQAEGVWLGHWLWTRFQDDIVQIDRLLSQKQTYSTLVALFIGLVMLLRPGR